MKDKYGVKSKPISIEQKEKMKNATNIAFKHIDHNNTHNNYTDITLGE